MSDDVFYDTSPTATGHDWFCNACTFVTVDYDKALAHCIAMRDESPYIHILHERRDLESYPVRRMAPESTGLINTIRIPPRNTRKGKKKY